MLDMIVQAKMVLVTNTFNINLAILADSWYSSLFSYLFLFCFLFSST